MKQITLLMTLLAFTFGFSQAQKTDYADFKEGFGDVVYTPQSFEHPSGAQAWGGFANMNTDLYPLTFENGGNISFDAPASADGAEIYFRFEFNPYPDTEPSLNLPNHIVTTGANVIEIPAGTNTFSSFLLYIVDRDVAVSLNSISVTTYDTDGVTALKTEYADFKEGFGDVVYTPQSFEHPSGAQAWGGFANMNTSMYPLSFENGGTITFDAPASADGAEIYFRLEFNPYPDTEPSVTLPNHIVTTGVNVIEIPAQGANTFSSFLLYVVDRDTAISLNSISITSDDNSAEPPAPEPASSNYADFYEGFGDVVYTPQSFEHPSGAQAWGGFANMNTDLYPLTFENGGNISFDAPASADGAEIYFRFEFNPYPDTEPSLNLPNHIVTTGANVIEIPAGTNTFSSFLLYIVDRDVAVSLNSISVTTYDTDGVTALKTEYADFKEGFGDVVYTPQSFEHPSGAQAWGGFANMNTSMYPLSFENGGTITFDAPASADGAEIYFRLEFNPYPDTEPSVTLPNHTIIDGENVVEIPAQGANTFSSLLLYVVDRDNPVSLDLVRVTANGASAGLEDNVLNSVKMFPNPAKDYVRFSSNSNEDLNIQIFDMLGKSVLRVDNVRNAVNVSELNAGLYFVQMTLGTQKSTKKLVIN